MLKGCVIEPNYLIPRHEMETYAYGPRDANL